MIHAEYVGEQYFVISVSRRDSTEAARLIRTAYTTLNSRPDPAIAALRPAVDTLVIEYREGFDPAAIVQTLEKLESGDTPFPPEAARPAQRVPVCYDASLAPDLEALSDQSGLSPDSILELHSSLRYQVWMLGFMPGFAYMGKLPRELRLPRKPTPVRVAAGSVAVAEEYTAVYPFDSPGGWYVIGRTPLSVTDYAAEKPFLFDYGMNVEFYPIPLEEYNRLCAQRTK